MVANPTRQELENSDIDLIVAGSKDAVVMVEGGGLFVTEDDMLEAIFFGHQSLQPIIDLQEKLKETAGVAKRSMPEEEADSGHDRRCGEEFDDIKVHTNCSRRA